MLARVIRCRHPRTLQTGSELRVDWQAQMECTLCGIQIWQHLFCASIASPPPDHHTMRISNQLNGLAQLSLGSRRIVVLLLSAIMTVAACGFVIPSLLRAAMDPID